MTSPGNIIQNNATISNWRLANIIILKIMTNIEISAEFEFTPIITIKPLMLTLTRIVVVGAETNKQLKLSHNHNYYYYHLAKGRVHH